MMTDMQQPQLVEDAPFTLEDVSDEPGSLTTTLVTIDSETGVVEFEDDMPEDTEENRAILERVEQRKKNLANEWWQLAADLYEVQQKKLHRLAGFEKLEQYFSRVIDNSHRYAFELTAIHRFFTIELSQTLADKPQLYAEVIEKVKLIGVTKTKEITKGKIKDPEVLVDIINQMSEPNENGYMPTVHELKTMIANYKHAQSEQPGSVELDEKAKKRQERQEQNKKEIFKFKLPFGQAEKVKEALNLVITRHEMPDDDKSKSTAFFRICEEWSIENQAGREGVRPGLQAELKRLEDIYNTKIVAFPATAAGELYIEDPNVGLSLLYGAETFAAIVADDDDEASDEAQQV